VPNNIDCVALGHSLPRFPGHRPVVLDFVKEFDRAEVAETVPQGSVDEIDFVDGLPGLVRHLAPQVIQANAPIRVRGWALDAGRLRAGAALSFEIHGKETVASFTEKRPDIAAAFGTAGLENSGFTVGLSTSGLPAGKYDLSANIQFPHDETWYPFATRTIFIAEELRDAPELGREARNKGRVELRGSIDAIDDLHRLGNHARNGYDFLAIANSALVIRGWIFHPEEQIERIRVRIGKSATVAGQFGSHREDIALLLAAPAAKASGFTIPVRLDSLSQGRYRITVECETKWGWFPLTDDYTIAVVPATDDFPIFAKLIRTPFEATFDDAQRSFESGHAISFEGSIDAADFDGAYLQVIDLNRPPTAERPPHRETLDYPLLDDDGKRRFSIATNFHLPRGSYEAWIVATTPDRRGYRKSMQSMRFDVVAPRMLRR